MSDSGFLRPGTVLPYCKGCGHAHVLRAIDEALDALELAPRDVCVVTDIGCVGLADAQIDKPHTVHTTHGRSTAFATGIALADAVLGEGRLKTLVMIGDGGSMIGLNHLVFAATINADITVVVHNNFLFGMTGGQHSAFSPVGFVTSTTRDGNTVPPLDLGALLAAARAPFVARVFATDRELAETIRRAVAHPGFAVVEVLELCTAHGTRRNPLGAARMKEIVEEAGYAVGILRDAARPRPLERPARGGDPAPPVETRGPLLEARLDRRYGIVLAGTAGERVQSAATALANAAIACGLQVSQKNDNPITQGSGFSLSELILSPRPIDFTGIETPDAVLVVSADGLGELGRSGTLARCGDETLILADEGLSLPAIRGKVRRAPLRTTAGVKGAAAAAVAWWIEETGALDRASLRG